MSDERATNFDQLPLALRVTDVMAILGIGRNSAYELLRSDKLPTVRVGRRILVSKEAVRSFLNCS